jgi:LysR family glycine cleavage system transcriptional activator
MKRIPLASLQAFVQVARTRNLSRTAEQLHLTVSALSHQMRGLEERLGKRLLLRGPRGVSLTPDGTCLLENLAGHFDGIENAMRAFAQRRDDALTLSVMGTFASSWLMPRLPRFVAKHPQLDLNLQSSANVVDFNRDAVDAALRFGPGQWPGVTAELLFGEWISPVASPALIKRLGKPKLSELGRWPLLGDPNGRWKDWFAQFGGEPPRRYVANFSDSETLQRAAHEGLGVALIRMTMARPLLDVKQLVLLTRERLRSDWSHYLVYPPRSAEHAGLRVFREWLLVEAKAYRDKEERAQAPVSRAKPKAKKNI